MFANGLGDWFNPRPSHTKDSKMVFDASLLHAQHYILWSNLVVASPTYWYSSNWKGSFGLPSTTVDQLAIKKQAVHFVQWLLLLEMEYWWPEFKDLDVTVCSSIHANALRKSLNPSVLLSFTMNEWLGKLGSLALVKQSRK